MSIKKQDQQAATGLELVLLRNAFYRDNYYRVLFCVLLLVVINVALLGMDYYKLSHPPQPQYFAATADGRIIQIHALSDPVLPDNFVLQWTADAVHKAFNLDFIHWREQLQNSSSNFTPDGWNYFTQQLKQSNDLKTLIDLQMVSNAVITGAPEVVEKAVVGGHYAWNIKMPMLITYKNQNKTINQPVSVTVIVLREPVQYYPQKIAINNVFIQTVSSQAYTNS